MFEKIRKIIAEQLSVDEETIALQSDFREDLQMDSLDVVDTLVALEDEFDIEIQDEDIEGIKTVEDLVNYLAGKVEA